MHNQNSDYWLCFGEKEENKINHKTPKKNTLIEITTRVSWQLGGESHGKKSHTHTKKS